MESIRAPFSKERLEALDDGIFGFAMTLLVININLPPSQAVVSIISLLYYIRYDLIQYVIAFIILALLWVAQHQQYYYIRYIDNNMLWFNVFSLLLVALMPFSTQLADTYPESHVSAAFFSGNLFLIGLIFLAQWRHASRGNRLLDDDLMPEIITDMYRRNTVIPAVSLLVIAISLLGVNWSMLLYFSVPFIFYAIHRSHRSLHEMAKRA